MAQLSYSALIPKEKHLKILPQGYIWRQNQACAFNDCLSDVRALLGLCTSCHIIFPSFYQSRTHNRKKSVQSHRLINHQWVLVQTRVTMTYTCIRMYSYLSVKWENNIYWIVNKSSSCKYTENGKCLSFVLTMSQVGNAGVIMGKVRHNPVFR